MDSGLFELSINAQIIFCTGSLQSAVQLGSRLSISLSLFLLVVTSNDCILCVTCEKVLLLLMGGYRPK